MAGRSRALAKDAKSHAQLLKALYEHLCMTGKKPLAARTAVRRKLVIRLYRRFNNDEF